MHTLIHTLLPFSLSVLEIHLFHFFPHITISFLKTIDKLTKGHKVPWADQLVTELQRMTVSPIC